MMPFSLYHLFILHYVSWYTYSVWEFLSCGFSIRWLLLSLSSPFSSNIIVNDSLQMWTIFFHIVVCCLLLLLLLLLWRFEYHFHQVFHFYLVLTLEKYSETTSAFHRKHEQKESHAKSWVKNKIVEAQRTKKHMLCVLSTKASCICKDFSKFRSFQQRVWLVCLRWVWLPMVTVALAAAATAVALPLSLL